MVVSWVEIVRKLSGRQETHRMVSQSELYRESISRRIIWYLPALICCLEAKASSCCKSSPCSGRLKTIGALDMVPGAVSSVEAESRRLAYNESPALIGLFEASGAIMSEI